MSAVIKAALIDSVLLVPFLLLIYIGIAWLEFRYEKSIQSHIRKAGKAGPLLGALFGCLPQCGFSVVGSALYTRGLITTGTLLAVFISTSDEAVPVIMANPARIGLIIPLLLTKVVLALLVGYGFDAVIKTTLRSVPPLPENVQTHDSAPASPHTDHDAATHAETTDGDAPIEVDACCGHHLPGVNKLRALLIHPLIHTGQVFLVLFIVSIGINLLVGLGGAHLGTLLLHDSVWQPVIATFVGLIPSCGASVALTEIYLKGGISFGAVIAGLSSSAGLGMLVLIKENRSLADTLRILGLLVGVSIIAGIIIQQIEPHIIWSWLRP